MALDDTMNQETIICPQCKYNKAITIREVNNKEGYIKKIYICARKSPNGCEIECGRKFYRVIPLFFNYYIFFIKFYYLYSGDYLN